MSAREDAALESIGVAAAPEDGAEVQIGEETWEVRYEPELTVLGVAGDFGYDHQPIQRIRLREWNERVFLHEVLHVVLNRRLAEYHAGDDWDSDAADPALAPPKEKIVQAVEDALWDMGWRWLAGANPVIASCVDLLAAHQDRYFDLTTPRRYTAHGGWNQFCICGQSLGDAGGDDGEARVAASHRAHWADLITEAAS
ncbi:MAG: hypothetical protein J7518_16535 [Nocardioidaceae bacterium]|nr:hypothetical protein [Nocardioidaceae bacterium]